MQKNFTYYPESLSYQWFWAIRTVLRCAYEVSIDYVILGANSTDLPRNETPESIRNSDVFIGVDFRFVELPDNFDCLSVINKYTFNCMQRIVFEASGQVYDLMKTSWQNEATKFALLGQVIRLVEEYLKSGAIVINPPLFNTDPVRQRIIYMMNMNKIVQHLWSFIKLEQTEKIAPIFDPNKKIRSTADMPTWFTSKPCYITKTSQISHCVFDSAWESTESYVIEKNPHVIARAKNDHLGFEILYVFDGVVRKYLPDFLIRLDNGKTLILETKGQETRRDKEKRKALSEWVSAVNSMGEYGEWCNDVSYNIADVDGIIAKYI